MKLVKTFALILAGVLTVTACKNQESKQEIVDNTGVVDYTNTAEENQNVVFEKTLTHGDYSFDIINTGGGSLTNLTIQPHGLENKAEITLNELDGKVTNAEIADLDADGYPEILVYTNSAGSGTYGNVIAYSVDENKNMTEIKLSGISQNDEANAGYMGHDEFAIVENRLTRKFPVYMKGDKNSEPTGETREIVYKLENMNDTKTFIISEIK